MSSPNDELDPLADLLAGEKPSGRDALRSAMLARTGRVLRRRRVARRCTLAATLAACYLAGAASLAAWRGLGGEDYVVAEGRQPLPAVNAADDRGKDAIPAPSPTLATRQEPGPAKSRFELLRHAGDRQWQERDDVESAVRYYGRAMKAASREELAVSGETDNWLVMALKEARLKEIRHGKDDG
ncbi:MAG: hypothetical protein ACYC35_20630 [Pirellulales bacterium]